MIPVKEVDFSRSGREKTRIKVMFKVEIDELVFEKDFKKVISRLGLE